MCLPEGERERERAMALEAVVFSQSQDPFGGYGSVKDFYNCTFLAATSPNWGDYEHININIHKEEEQGSISTFLDNSNNQPDNYPYGGDWTSSSSSILPHLNDLQEATDPSNATHSLDTLTTRPKRRRAKSRKNKEEIENQRMTHIAVERNRRKQMNEYLSVLRSLMPDSYIQRKEGERKSDAGGATNMPFSEFFAFPQYSTSGGGGGSDNSATVGEDVGEVKSGIADIEVTMVESHANLKIRSKKRPKQLLKLVSGLHTMRLTILHLNVTTTGEIVLYSLSVKVEDDCKLGSVDDIAEAVYQTLDRIQQEAVLN
ncbi:Transcription factor bHLH94 Basic helix-loop-helix protein [Vigna angularis]|uniref:Transcription factor bHLH94 Basic helix-loop-helix protein n=1 Tax=Phaseolus angularis TaxID=3914 RepID=A0A8T0KTD4_PHAAN|nr:Transcription factor bHLH94 Basic helix-loop-helix protein [Vigna angularis]